MKLNSIIKTFGGAFILVATPFLAKGALLSPEQSLRRAESSKSILKMPGAAKFMLAHTEKSDDENYIYVFNNGETGFIVTSADDRMPALLGYSQEGSFNIEDASPELKWWLSEYATEASRYFSSNVASEKVVTSTRSDRTSIPALLTTQWNQDFPYNLDCPTDNGGKCVTGCVATALAQIIKYHNYPVTGTGSYSYTWQGQTLSFDYGNTTFDYANMLDEYTSAASESQQAAVAKLMYACGVGVNMDYTSDQSGASDVYVPYVLKEHFNYDKDIRYLRRDCYSAEEWDEIVYRELQAGRPVMYGGQSDDGGHEFVCDGYQDGYFHINWGWSGMGDGWFLLSALDPGLQGIGGFAGGYNSNQDIICGIQPNAGNPQTTYPLIATGGLTAGDVIDNFITKLTISNGGIILNYSPYEINTTFFLKAVSASGDETVAENGIDLSFKGCEDGMLSGYSGFTIYLPNVGEGSYKVYLMYKGPQGDLQPLPIPLSGADHLDMDVDAAGNVSFSKVDPEQKAKINISELSPLSTVYSGQPTDFKISIQNISEYNYSGLFFIKASAKNSEDVLSENRVQISIAAGEELNGSIRITYDLPDGEYELRCYDMYDELCSETFPLLIGEREIPAEDITLNFTEKTLTEGETMTLTATVNPEDATDKTVTWSSSDPSVASVDNGLVTAIAPGYAVITASTTNGLTATCNVTVEAEIILATSISLNKTTIEAEIGETITLIATVLPEETTDKTISWESSDSSIATVDQEGNVTIIANGYATITASTTDGSDLHAECAVYGMTSVQVLLMESGPIDIYSLDGVLIRKNADSEYFEKLAKGTYIIRTSDKAIKITK